MSFICLMLFVAICTFSSGLGISRGLNNDVADLTQFDATVGNLNGDNLIDSLGKSNIDSFADYAQYTNYDSKVPYSKFLTSDGIEKGSSYYPVFTDSDIMAIGLTEFNNILRLLGKDQVSLKENEYLAFTDIGDMQKVIQESINNKTKININGKSLIPADMKVLNITIYDSTMKSNICTFVVNDDLITELSTINSYLNLNLNYKGDKSESEIGMKAIIKSNNDKNGYQIYYINRETIEATKAGLGAMVSYLAIYMGIIFLITSAAVLALQQLCESADNTYRYELLKKVGVDEKIVNKSLLTLEERLLFPNIINRIIMFVIIELNTKYYGNLNNWRKDNMINFAHRGASKYFPENTILAFKEGIKSGAKGIELDVHKSKDNKLVIIHDEDIERTFKGKGLIKDMTLDELKSFKCRNINFKDNLECRIPTLEEVLELIKDTDITLNIELKTDQIHYDGIEQDVIDMVNKYGLKKRIILSSFNHNSIKICRRIDSEIETGLLYAKPIENVIEYAKSFGADAIHPYLGLVSEELLKEANKNNIKVNIYTVNSPEHMRILIKAGVNGVFTDYPDLLQEIMESI